MNLSMSYLSFFVVIISYICYNTEYVEYYDNEYIESL